MKLIFVIIGIAAVVLLLGYLLGCFNGSVMVSHFVIKDDVRAHGSGNAGLTNFYRTFGGPLTLVDYPRSADFFARLRAAVNREILERKGLAFHS